VTGGEPILRVDGLSVEFRTRQGVVKALDRVGFAVAPGERVAVVGESGSGKSVTAYALLGLLDPAARVTGGQVLYRGRELLTAPERERRRVRGREIAMIFQSPRAALSPVRTVGRHLVDVLRRHHGLGRREARARAIDLLDRVYIPDPARRFGAYPFELSGGMCQRVLIAAALACEPSFLIADEPTTGLDVTTQACIVELLGELCAERKMALLFITHDLPLAAGTSDRLLVMHAGQVVEDAPTARLLARPRHPYSARLLAAVPASVDRLQGLQAIPGSLPICGALRPAAVTASAAPERRPPATSRWSCARWTATASPA
jgi:oligopeptide/dipeptide ABC transporter ATP-binding protein